jgi:hypothetical protein
MIYQSDPKSTKLIKTPLSAEMNSEIPRLCVQQPSKSEAIAYYTSFSTGQSGRKEECSPSVKPGRWENTAADIAGI